MSSSSSSNHNTVELQDRLDVLFRQETTFYLTSDYLGALIQKQQHKAVDDSRSSGSNNSKMLNQHWREVMCEWAYHVVDHFDFPRDIVSACMSFLDRYLAHHVERHPEGIPKHAFQLLAMTCLYIAVKLDQPRMLSLETMAHLSRGTFSKAQMQAMEMEILTNLNWHVHPPTPYTFLSYFIQLSKPNPAASKIYEMARYFVELSVLDYYFVGKQASTVAIAALMNAFEDHLSYEDLSVFVAPGQDELVRDCQARLRSLYNVPDQSVFDQGSGAPQQPIYGRTSSPTCVTQNIM
ncbi:diatom-specific cyclin [Seminavis robusta]|uniref:Diatom-specific cyclin n=1 Tax=Seminavis robusta TaxID=568900 RepID=A0A9N8E0L6_9STRA|nr:diatom-specific cyclin [Seminavis robusta]|eukprot:Sro506_g156280.1 diatom-specific cyclin (293) ;mRNA; r:15199-16164